MKSEIHKNKVINIVCDYASIYGGNFIPSILRFANLIKDSYFVFFTFPLEAKERNWAQYIINSGFSVQYIEFHKKTFRRELKKLNRLKSVNVVYTHFLSSLRIKLMYPFSFKTKLLFHIHTDVSCGTKAGLFAKAKNFIEHRILRTDAVYFFVSKDLKNAYKVGKNHYYLPNALCLERVPCNCIDAETLKSNYHINKENTVYLTFAWNPFVKGTDIIVKAFLDDKNQNNKLIIVYKRDGGYEKCVSYLKETLKSDSFLQDNRIIFAPPIEDVFNYYKISDVFISASRSEGFSYSILESLYFGLKVISSDIKGTEWAKSYDSVISFESENSAKLNSIINNLKSFKKHNNVQEKMIHDFDIDCWCAAIKEKADELIK